MALAVKFTLQVLNLQCAMTPRGHIDRQRRTRMSDELKRAIESLRDYRMSQSELDAQRISFVYGNAASKGNDTKESVKKAIDLAQIN